MNQKAAIKATSLIEANLNPATNTIRGNDLTETTYHHLTKRLEKFGNTLSDLHKEALSELSDTYTKIIQGDLQGRYAFGIDTGMGKTTSIIALCMALHELKADNVGVLVCLSKVEALCELKEQMIAEGIPENKVGLVHSYSDTTLPSTDDLRQFQLVTHARASRENIFKQNQWKSKDRALVIWDESLIASESFSLSEKDIDKAVHCLTKDEENNTQYSDLIDHFSRCKELVAEALNNLKDAKKNNTELLTKACELPQLSEIKMVLFKDLVNKKKAEWYHSYLSTLLTMSGMQVRPALANGQDGIISYQISVPRELSNIVVLDASWHIRELEKLDKSIRCISKVNPCDLKKYDHVHITQIKQRSGRSAMTEEFNKFKSSDSEIRTNLLNILNEIPEDEKVLIFTFKDRGQLSMSKEIRKDLAEAGISLIDSKGNQRVYIETWGNETSSNAYSDCTNVILLGLLHLPKLEIISSIVAQKGNINAKLDSKEITRIHKSEIAHRAFQALSRGSCRKVSNGYAHPVKAWIFHPYKNLRPILEKVMSNVEWTYVNDVNNVKAGVTHRLSMEILECLKLLPEDVLNISMRDLKARFPDITKPPLKTFSNAINQLEDYSKAWIKQGRSLVRKINQDAFQV